MGDQYGEITRPNRMRIQLNWAVTCEFRILGQDNKEIVIDCFCFFFFWRGVELVAMFGKAVSESCPHEPCDFSHNKYFIFAC